MDELPNAKIRATTVAPNADGLFVEAEVSDAETPPDASAAATPPTVRLSVGVQFRHLICQHWPPFRERPCASPSAFSRRSGALLTKKSAGVEGRDERVERVARSMTVTGNNSFDRASLRGGFRPAVAVPSEHPSAQIHPR